MSRWKKYTTIVGIDPGMGGAVTIMTESGLIDIFDVPLMEEGKGKNKKKVYDIISMSNIIRPHKGKKTIICIELVHAMPGQGVSSTFGFGRGLGIWEGIIAGLSCDKEVITPQRWKKQWADVLLMTSIEKPEILKSKPEQLKKMTKASKEEFLLAKKEYGRKRAKQKEAAKDAARLLASKIYPNLSDKFKLKKHDGRAESLLIAERKRLEITNE